MQNGSCTTEFDDNGDRNFSNSDMAHWNGADCIAPIWNTRWRSVISRISSGKFSDFLLHSLSAAPSF